MIRSLLRLIEYSILPAVIIILAKFGGIYLSAVLFNIQININAAPASWLTFQNLVAVKDIVIVSSYSDLFMYLGIAIGMSVILVQALYFHDSHISPAMVNRLAKNNLLSLIRSSFDLYHSGVIWLAFLWVANVVILINCMHSLTDLWTLFICTIFTISYSIIFMKDLFAEIELTNNANYN